MIKKKTALRQNIERLEKRRSIIQLEYNDLMKIQQPTAVNFARVDQLNGMFVILNQELEENRKLLEVEREDLIEAHNESVVAFISELGFESEPEEDRAKNWFNNKYEIDGE